MEVKEMKKLAAIQISGLTPGISGGKFATDYMSIYLDNSVVGNSKMEDRNENGSTKPMNFYLRCDGSDYEEKENPANTLLVFGVGV